MLALCTPDFDLIRQNTLLTLLQGLLCSLKTIKILFYDITTLISKCDE